MDNTDIMAWAQKLLENEYGDKATLKKVIIAEDGDLAIEANLVISPLNFIAMTISIVPVGFPYAAVDDK